ncbi:MULTISPECIES: substrate-binding domain-containing protein [Curtobacterium]|uniref:LacI family DNA-binding transcriptional regulator n=1 Tax=Curtobacterium flaccumfaciens TaxID=2035 RepID=UPI003EE530C8
MSTSRPPTITDVAELAGVSRAAVSKVLRGAYGVSPGMRERVEAAIRSLDYRPSAAARALRGRGWTIGVELVSVGNPFFDEVLAGITATIATSPYQLVLAPATSDSGHGRRALDALVDRNVDGLIAISPLVPRPELESIARRVPLVLMGRHNPSGHYDSVVGDDVAGTHLALEHLASLGHRRIAHLTVRAEVVGTDDGNPHRIRAQAYRSFMAERFPEVHPHTAHVRSTAQDDVDAAMAELLFAEHHPTALFAADDGLGIRALWSLTELGLVDQVALVGYDGSGLGAHPALALTSVDQHGAALGAAAARHLLARIDGRTEAVDEVLAPALRVRRSSLVRPRR